jgi:hypothetical protein
MRLAPRQRTEMLDGLSLVRSLCVSGYRSFAGSSSTRRARGLWLPSCLDLAASAAQGAAGARYFSLPREDGARREDRARPFYLHGLRCLSAWPFAMECTRRILAHPDWSNKTRSGRPMKYVVHLERWY